MTGVVLGAAVGGVLGGLVGVVVGSRLAKAKAEDRLSPKDSVNGLNGTAPHGLDGSKAPVEESRRTLEDQIAQLNDAIDAVRDQLNRPPLADNGNHPADE